MAGHAPFFETDGLPALGTRLPPQAVAILVSPLEVTAQVAFFKHPAIASGIESTRPPSWNTGCSPPIPFSCFTICSAVTPARRARDTKRPIASVLAVVERPDFPIVAKISNGRPPYSVTVTYKLPEPGFHLCRKALQGLGPFFHHRQKSVLFLGVGGIRKLGFPCCRRGRWLRPCTPIHGTDRKPYDIFNRCLAGRLTVLDTALSVCF